MRVELSAVILQQTANSTEFFFDSGGIVRSHSASHSKQCFTCLCAILMENENREDIAEKHSSRDERYASQDQYAASAQASEREGRTWDGSGCHNDGFSRQPGRQPTACEMPA